MSDIKKFNVIADKVSFFSKVALLSDAIADNDSPTPGYLYHEITNITFESGSHCLDLSDFLFDQLTGSTKSHHVKYKVLKILKFIVINGHPDFRARLRKVAGPALTEATKCSGTVDPIHGMTPYHVIRKEAKVLIDLLFTVTEDELLKSSPPKIQVSQGMGNVCGGKLTGFGNTPAQPKSMGESFVTGVMQLAEKVMSPQTPTQHTSPADKHFSHYEPVSIDVSGSDSAVENGGNLKREEQMRPSPRRDELTPSSGYKKGVAGGGWADDSDLEHEDSNPLPQDLRSQQMDDSLASSIQLSNLSLSQSEDETSSREYQLVESYLQNTTTFVMKHKDLRNFVNCCEGLRCCTVINILNKHLSEHENDNVKMRCLLLIEALMRTDVVNTDEILSVCADTFTQLLQNNATKAKAAKILKTLECLSTQDTSQS